MHALEKITRVTKLAQFEKKRQVNHFVKSLWNIQKHNPWWAAIVSSNKKFVSNECGMMFAKSEIMVKKQVVWFEVHVKVIMNKFLKVSMQK